MVRIFLSFVLSSDLRTTPGFFYAKPHAGHKIGAEQDTNILTYRERFEAIIKTDGEDSGGAAGLPQPPVSSPAPQAQVLANGTPGVPPVQSGPVVADEKRRSWKGEKAANGMV